MKRLIMLLILSCIGYELQAAVKLDYLTALSQKSIWSEVTGTAQGHTGKTMAMSLRNISNTDLTIQIPLGLVLEPSDTGVQNMIVTAPLLVTLRPHQSQSLEVYAMCIQKNDAGPDAKEKFTSRRMASDKLVQVANLIHELQVQDALGQSALWVVSDHQSITTIWDERIEQANKLRTLTADLTGQTLVLLDPATIHASRVEPYIPPPIRRWYPEFKINVAADKDIKVVLTKHEGELIQELYNGKSTGEEMNLHFELTSTQLPKGRYKVLIYINGVQRSQIAIDNPFGRQ